MHLKGKSVVKASKAKKRSLQNRTEDSMKVTRRLVEITGIRAILAALAVVFSLGMIYILRSEGKPGVNAQVYGNYGVAIGQARDVTVNHGMKESK